MQRYVVAGPTLSRGSVPQRRCKAPNPWISGLYKRKWMLMLPANPCFSFSVVRCISDKSIKLTQQLLAHVLTNVELPDVLWLESGAWQWSLPV